MATLTTQTPVAGGTVESLAAATAGAGGDIFRNTGKELVVVNNAAGAPITVTFVAIRACNQGTLHDLTWAVAAGAREVHPPPDTTIFNNDDGFTKMTFSSATSVTVGVMKAS